MCSPSIGRHHRILEGGNIVIPIGPFKIVRLTDRPVSRRILKSLVETLQLLALIDMQTSGYASVLDQKIFELPDAMAARQPARRAMVPNDGHEIRIHVTERKISGGTRSVDGRDCRDAFLGVMRTTPKRGIVFFGRLVIDATFPTTRLNLPAQTSPAVALCTGTT
jgi:hypothetical protein